jgi:uncharacterized phage protein gp47/JayE
VNGDSHFLVDRPYADTIDDILTAMIGGVTNEPIVFDVKQDRYPLSRAAQDIRSITGTVAAARHTFQRTVDYLYSAADRSVAWQAGGTLPDDDTSFFVDYAVPDSGSPITDVNIGSVSRTMSEAIGREIATVYEQINLAYRAGYVDTATGSALDLVVSILGVVRKPKQLAIGLATFLRDPGIDGTITVPAGSVVTTAKAAVRFATSEERTLQRGQARIDVPIRAEDGFGGAAGVVAAGAITEMLAPIAGIGRVTNTDPTFASAEGENDEQLRARAKAVLRSSGKATLGALIRVVLEGNGRVVEVWEGENPDPTKAPLGTVTMLVEAEPERIESLRAAVHETRAAGVVATLVARYVFVTPRLAITVRRGLTPQGKTKVVASVIAAMQSYVDGLTSGDPAAGANLLAASRGVQDVTEVRIAEVLTWRSDLGSPGSTLLADAVLDALAAIPGADEPTRRAAVEAALDSSVPALPPTGRRIPDRSLLQRPDGSPAGDDAIDAGEFVVAATVGGEPFWVVLDVAPADISVREA